MRNIIDINLEKYCNAGLVGVPYSQVDHSLTDLRKGKKRKQGSEPREDKKERKNTTQQKPKNKETGKNI